MKCLHPLDRSVSPFCGVAAVSAKLEVTILSTCATLQKESMLPRTRDGRSSVPLGLWDSRMSLLCCCNLDGDKKQSLQYMASGSCRFVRRSGHMAADISFSISPEGLGELFDVMVKAIPQQPFGDFSATWSKVQHCLDSAAEWACAHGRADQCRVLKRLSALLKYGEWGATPLDVPPHPKIAGACLIWGGFSKVLCAD